METKTEKNDYRELLKVFYPWYPTYRQILNEFNQIFLNLVKADIILKYRTLRYVEIVKLDHKYVIQVYCSVGTSMKFEGEYVIFGFDGATEIDEAMDENPLKIRTIIDESQEHRTYELSVPEEKLELITEFADIWTEIVDTDEKSIELRQKLLQYLKDKME
jgi:hypothetical protein